MGVLSGSEVATTSTEVHKMRLSENATSMVFQLFTQSIYSNPIGTVVREITSNCFDSHIEAKVPATVPVVIKKSFDAQTSTHYISFIDFGVGMSPDRVKNIYGVYFESTKRTDNEQIGGFGIGAKSVLAYKRPTGHGQGEYDNSFYVITTFNGVKYYYCIFEGQEAPVISLLHQEQTTDRNGTEVRIPVLERDLNTFSKEMVRQLYYFENVVFEGFEGSNYEDTLTNEYNIVRGQNFLYRGTEYSNQMHVCLGRVAYPIDFSVLGLYSNDYNLPIALSLKVGDINVTASREQLDYNENTIKVLKAKLELAKAEIKEMLAKQYENIVSLKDYIQVKNEFGILKFPNGMSMKVNGMIKQSEIDFSNFRYSFMKMPNDKQLFRFFFNIKNYSKKSSSRYRYSNDFECGYDRLKSCSNILYIENDFNRKVSKQAYLKHKFENYFIINRRDLLSSMIRGDIADLFNVHIDKVIDDKGNVNSYIQSLIDMQDEYWQIVIENADNYDTLEVPAEFTVRKKRNVLSDELRNTTIPVKIFGSYGKKRMKLDVLFKFNITIFYGTQDDKGKLENAHEMFKLLFDEKMIVNDYSEYYHKLSRNDKNKGIMFIMVSNQNAKYLQYCKRAIHVNEYYNKLLYRKADMIENFFQSYNLIEKYYGLNELYKSKSFSEIDQDWGKIIDEVSNFISGIQKKSRLANNKYELAKYFNVHNLKMKPEHTKYAKQIDSLYKLQNANADILRFINIPYSSDLNSKLVEILKKVMVL